MVGRLVVSIWTEYKMPFSLHFWTYGMQHYQHKKFPYHFHIHMAFIKFSPSSTKKIIISKIRKKKIEKHKSEKRDKNWPYFNRPKMHIVFIFVFESWLQEEDEAKKNCNNKEHEINEKKTKNSGNNINNNNNVQI